MDLDKFKVSKKKQESQENATIRLETYKALEELKN